MKNIKLWFIGILLISTIGVASAYYVWKTLIIPFEVMEPLEALDYPSQFSLYPGDTKEFNVTVVNHASHNYTVNLDFSLSNATYQESYVTFGDETYLVRTGEQTLTAWLKVEAYAPPINTSLTINLKRIGEWWNNDWLYRRRINITENSGYDLIDFPVEVVFEHNGNAQPDGDEIRVIDNGIEIPSCITVINSTYATVVFEVNATAFSTKSVYVYYGNPTATSPSYPLVPLTISEGNTGYAVIDNSVYIGWEYCKWGYDGDNDEVVLWTDFKIDFNKNGNPIDDNDLLTDVGGRRGGIGRFRIDYGNAVVRGYGLGDYIQYVQTPICVNIVFDNATLRVYKGQTLVETTQADRMLIWGAQWDYGKSGVVSEQNIVDGLNTTSGSRDYLYLNYSNPLWMAFRNSGTGDIITGSGFNIEQSYMYLHSAKEANAWDRNIWFDVITIPEELAPNDQPLECKIYWYGDNSNNYSKIEMMAQILHNQPSILVEKEFQS